MSEDRIARIPGSALGNEQMFDVLSAFPGADYEKVISANSAAQKARYTIWSKKPAPSNRLLH
jgi:hypothetical protein